MTNRFIFLSGDNLSGPHDLQNFIPIFGSQSSGSVVFGARFDLYVFQPRVDAAPDSRKKPLWSESLLSAETIGIECDPLSY